MTDRSQSASMQHAHDEQGHAFSLTRIASLALAGGLLLVLAFFPGLLMRGDALLTQAVMPLLLLGIGASLAHGMGWRPRGSILAAAVGPLVAWPLTFAAFAFIVFRAGAA